VKRDQTQPTEAGYLPYNPDRPPTRKAVAAAMQPTEDDCTSMVDGGICKHGVNCHMVMGQKERPARMGESTRRSLAFMTPEQHQEKIEQAARMADEYLAQQEAATLPPMPPQPDPAATIEAINALAAAFHSVDARENAENAQRIAQLEQAVGGRVG
jgi:hypothetical protein